MRDLAYNILITLSWPVLLFYYKLRAVTDGKYRTSYRARLGLTLPGKLSLARSMPPDAPANEVSRPDAACKCVWLHALSVGETLSVIPLVEALGDECPGVEIVFSSATEAGLRIAEQRLAPWVSTFFFLPHDFPWAMQAVIGRLEPSLFVLVETDIWPNLPRALKRRGAAVMLVNGRISARSFSRYERLMPWVKDLFSCFDLVFAQSGEDRERYVLLGCPQDRVHAVGNLKFDSALARPARERIEEIRTTSGIGRGEREGEGVRRRPLWVGGSTHEGEEEILLRVHKAIRSELPGALLVLAPRQVARAREIAALCSPLELSVATRSSGGTAAGCDVYILDTLGELTGFYELGDAAFVGGSLVPFGGHNPLEPAALGKPTCWGPHLSNFREMERDLMDAGCGRVVASEEELLSVMRGWLKDPARRDEVKHAAKGFVESHAGTGKRIVGILLEEWSRRRTRDIP